MSRCAAMSASSRDVSAGGRGRAPSTRRTDPIQPLHCGEVERRLWLIVEDRVGESRRLFQREPESGVEPPLVAKRGDGDGTERLAAGAAGAMAGPDLQLVACTGKRAQ